MKISKIFILGVIIFYTGTVFSQIKLKSLNDFQEPKGAWFQAEKVKLDSLNPELFTYEKGEGIFINGTTGKTAHLISKESFGDIELHLEFLLPKGSNSGIYFHSKYEIQIFDSHGKEHPDFADCGGIYQRWDKTKPKGKKGYEGISPRVNATFSLGKWQTYDIIFRAPRFNASGKKIKNAMFEKVILNGTVIHENMEVTGATREGMDGQELAMAPLRLQGNHGRVAYRNIRIRKLDNTREKILNKWVDLFENNTETGPNYDYVVHGDVADEISQKIFEYKDKQLEIMYKWESDEVSPYAIAVTKKVYHNYDLKFEFKWGNRRFKPRMDKIRDAGLLYHTQVGNYAWPSSLEYQIQEGDCGDLWTILGPTCDVIKEGEITKVKVASYASSKKWTDEEKPGWNQVLLKVRDNSAKYYLNGVLVNEIINATYGGLSCESGFIALQAEHSELIYRKIKVKEI